jgi:hypothetical protein
MLKHKRVYRRVTRACHGSLVLRATGARAQSHASWWRIARHTLGSVWPHKSPGRMRARTHAQTQACTRRPRAPSSRMRAVFPIWQAVASKDKWSERALACEACVPRTRAHVRAYVHARPRARTLTYAGSSARPNVKPTRAHTRTRAHAHAHMHAHAGTRLDAPT